MSFKFKVLGLFSALVLVGCGSGDNAKDDHEDVPFVDFKVNGNSYPTAVTVSRFHQDYDANARTDDAGTPDDTDDDVKVSVFCDPYTYQNGSTVGASFAEYCANERSFINASSLGIRFSVRLFNNTYEDYDVTYTGIGFTIRVFEYDDTQPDFVGDEVWNSDYEYQRRVEILRSAGNEEIEDFTLETNTVTLGPVGIYPDLKQFGSNGYTLYFSGKQNIIGDGGTPARAPGVFDAANLYAWPSVSGEYDGSCDWSPVTIDYSPDTADVSDPNYEKVVCDSKMLLPYPSVDEAGDYSAFPNADSEGNLRFIARVEFNFNNGEFQSPDDIVITITPP